MILVDAGPIVALFDPRDGYRARARNDFRLLQRQRFTTIVPVLAEVLFHLPTRNLRTQLFAWFDQFGVQILPFDLGEIGRIRDWLFQYAEHEPDFADAALIVSFERLQKASLWTYDSEFTKIWRRPDGSRVPLAV